MMNPLINFGKGLFLITTLYSAISTNLYGQIFYTHEEVELTPQGVILPRIDTATIAPPVKGQVIFDVRQSRLMFYNGSEWVGLEGIFERVDSSNLIRPRLSRVGDNFLVGSERIEFGGYLSGMGRLFFHENKRAFRAGSDFDLYKDTTGKTYEFGGNRNWNIDSLGIYSFASGIGTKATGDFGASALGFESSAAGEYGASALGESSIARGNNGAVAMGYNSVASGNYGSIALGDNAVSNGNYGAIAMGFETHANGDYSMSSGFRSIAEGEGSVVGGKNNKAQSYYEKTIGFFADTVVGANAHQWIPGNILFAIGNGTSHSDRRNALTLLKNGKLGLGVTEPNQDLTIFDQDETGSSIIRMYTQYRFDSE